MWHRELGLTQSLVIVFRVSTGNFFRQLMPTEDNDTRNPPPDPKRRRQQLRDVANEYLNGLDGDVLDGLAILKEEENTLIVEAVDNYVCNHNQKLHEAPELTCPLCKSLLAQHSQSRTCVQVGPCGHHICSECAGNFFANTIVVDGVRSNPNIEPLKCPKCMGARYDALFPNWTWVYGGSKLTDLLIAAYPVKCMCCPLQVTYGTLQTHLQTACEANWNLDNTKHVCVYCHESHGPFFHCKLKLRVWRLAYNRSGP
jgi:hypothetical protein